MAKTKLEVGLRWGHLEVIKQSVECKTVQLSQSIRESHNEAIFDVRCSCGHVIRIWRDEWRGKKHFRDCGCGASLDDGAIVVMTVSVPLRVRRIVKKRADRNRISVSQALRELVELGAEHANLD